MPVIKVCDIEDTRLDVYRKLTNHQLRAATEIENGIFICESKTCVEVALESGVSCLSLLVDERKVDEVRQVCERLDRDPDIFVIDESMTETLCGYRVTRGVLGAFVRPVLPSLDDILKNSQKICVLEGLVDTSNVGAIFRNAAALGVDAIILSPTCADALCRRSVRVSMGCVLQIPFTYAPKPYPYSLFEKLHEYGFTSVGFALDDRSVPIDDKKIKEHQKLCLFFGCEGYGLEKKTLEMCCELAIIPMHHNVDSLNVATASAIGFWELCK